MENKNTNFNSEEISALSNMFNESYSYHTNINGFIEWAKPHSLDMCHDKYFNEDCDSEKEALESFDDSEFSSIQHNTILFLLHKGFLSKENAKELFQGQTFGSCCYGDYRKNPVFKELGLSFESK